MHMSAIFREALIKRVSLTDSCNFCLPGEDGGTFRHPFVGEFGILLFVQPTRPSDKPINHITEDIH
jgi:hypothetical protein